MTSTINAFAATAPKAPLQAFEYTPGALGDEDVEIAVESCGICHNAGQRVGFFRLSFGAWA